MTGQTGRCIGIRNSSSNVRPRGSSPLVQTLESNDAFLGIKNLPRRFLPLRAHTHPLATLLPPKPSPHSHHPENIKKKEREKEWRETRRLSRGMFRHFAPFTPSCSSSFSLQSAPDTTTTTPSARASSSSKANAPGGSLPINASDGAATPHCATAPPSEYAPPPCIAPHSITPQPPHPHHNLKC